MLCVEQRAILWSRNLGLSPISNPDAVAGVASAASAARHEQLRVADNPARQA
jgi:hypothetical protein